MPKVKVCGIKEKSDALLLSELPLWALGFILVEDSPRFIPPDKAKEIVRFLPSWIIKVGVFQNQSVEEVEKLRDFCDFDLVQLHGKESPAFCEKLGKGVIKTFSVGEDFDVAMVEEYLPVVDFLLFDSKKGGSGLTFPWKKIKGINFPKPIIIGGGLREENVWQCLSLLRPFALDLNSGVEVYPGKKDGVKVKRILEKIGGK
ncbi:MAG: phosphoribosylanthranilate isomerase [Candidatus Atribacteria bacterium]|nr:phosphoribosylanthranilate isomerase [Candidatus Atribacteria bacterium]